ncbi:MAG TPA: D-2-hydroxyacid dehydrogenase [Candidatus Elarobacter sp.]|nr:D-2-hydroxyacid dehydrogenase [Candidatus Elarobacter sp.]
MVRTPVLGEQLVAAAARHGVDAVAASDAEALHTELADADALWVWPAFYDPALVEALTRSMPRLRWLQVLTMGYDPLVAHGVPAGLVVTNAGDAYAPTVAEHAVTTLAALVRRLPEMLANAAASKWDQSVAGRIGTLNDATIAVLGFGNIGKEIAVRLRAFGARVVAVTRSGRADPLAHESVTADRLHDVLGRVDAVIVAVPLDGATRHMIDASALAALRPHALLVNIARGGIVDTAALRDALAAGRLAGAALDVTDPEPLPAEDPLWTMPNVIVTPHVAGYGGDTPARRVLALLDRNLRHFLAAEPLEAQISV